MSLTEIFSQSITLLGKFRFPEGVNSDTRTHAK